MVLHPTKIKKAKTIYPLILRMSDKKVQICIGVTDGKRNKVKPEDQWSCKRSPESAAYTNKHV